MNQKRKESVTPKVPYSEQPVYILTNMDRQITDPTDFSSSKIPNLTQLDSLLRCHICKDFLKVPVLTPCGHTFCSLCIREYIKNSAKCPLCLSELRESMLRSEFLVTEIIECYTALRFSLIESLQLDQVKKVQTDNSPEEIIDSSLIEIDSDPELEITEPKDRMNDDIEIVASNEKPSTSHPNIPKTNKIAKPGSTLLKKKSRSTVESMFTKSSKIGTSTSQQMAQCPICQEFYPLRLLERSHLDECLNLQSLGKLSKHKKPTMAKSMSTLVTHSKGLSPIRSEPESHPRHNIRATHPSRAATPQPKAEVSYVTKYLNSMANTERRERLPKLDYTSLSMTQLRQKLGALNLPSTGSKQNLIDRYNHYEILWNSNFCDSLNPVDETDLRRQLISWEASHASLTGNSRNTIGNLIQRGDKGYQKLMANFKNDKFERKTWIRMFSKDFRRLIKEAKSKYRNVNEVPTPIPVVDKSQDPKKQENSSDAEGSSTSEQPESLTKHHNENSKDEVNYVTTQFDNADISTDEDLSRDLSQHMKTKPKTDG